MRISQLDFGAVLGFVVAVWCMLGSFGRRAFELGESFRDIAWHGGEVTGLVDVVPC